MKPWGMLVAVLFGIYLSVELSDFLYLFLTFKGLYLYFLSAP